MSSSTPRQALQALVLISCLALAACGDESSPPPGTTPDSGGTDTGRDSQPEDTDDPPDMDTDAGDVPDMADAPEDADTSDAADVPDLPDVGAPTYSSAIGGVAREFPSISALEGVKVCVDGRDPADCVLTGEEGTFRIGHVTAGEKAVVRFTEARHVTALMPWQPTGLDSDELSIPMMRPALLEAIYADAQIEQDPARGALGILVADAQNPERPGQAGATVEVDGSSVIYFNGSVPDPEATQTDITGLVMVPNLDAGEVEFSVAGPERYCLDGLRWEQDGTLSAPVEAGAITLVYISCARSRGEGQACSEGQLCQPEPAACIVGGDGATCRAGVAGCDEETVCIDEVLVTRCDYKQVHGVDCAAAGGTCDARNQRCSVPAAQRCPRVPCDEGEVCDETIGDVCVAGFDCAQTFDCLIACADDEDCADRCAARVLPDAAEATGALLTCIDASRCAANFAQCETDCADAWAACLTP